jgi:RND family efflux transporter MFP subunit
MMRHKQLIRKILTGILSLSLIILSNPGFSEEPLRGLQIISVKENTIGNMTPVGGTVIPYQEVTLTAQTPGRVEFIGGEEGDVLQKGKLLVQLDQNKLLAQRQAAYAKLRESQVVLNNANMQFTRELASPRSNSYQSAPGGMGAPAMFDQMFSKPMSDMMGMQDTDVNRAADIENQRAMIEQAYSGISQTQAQIQQIEESLRDTKSVAPFAGKIFKKHIEVGDTVQPGTPLITFANVDFLQIQADLSVKLANQLKQGDIITASIDTIHEPFEVRVSRVFPGADNQRHTVTVKFDLPKDIKVATGTYAEVHIPGSDLQSISSPTIPYSAVMQRSGLQMVFIVDQDNVTDLRIVRLGERLGQSVKVLTGITVGQRIIANPNANLRAGLKLE